ncbi:MAG TPA: hypothetical protein VF739_14170 [Ktedonobacterales bacterium]
MSDSSDSETGRISDNASSSVWPLPQPSLDALALSETLAHLRVAGAEPRLDQLLAILNESPDAAGPLADALLAHADDVTLNNVAYVANEVDSDERVTALSPGAQRGLAAIFGTAETPTPIEDALDERDQAPMLVAEQAAVYQTHDEIGAGSGLLDLAWSRRLDAESLAAQIMLTPTAIQWLDHVALPLERQPDALVSHLVGALRVERARVHEALAAGEPLAGADASGRMADLLARHGALTKAQRRYWDALLATTP